MSFQLKKKNICIKTGPKYIFSALNRTSVKVFKVLFFVIIVWTLTEYIASLKIKNKIKNTVQVNVAPKCSPASNFCC